MQFREFGEWITRIADVEPTMAYVLLASPADAEKISELSAVIGVRDRFQTFVVPSLPEGRMFVVTNVIGEEPGVDSQPLIDALQAAGRVDLEAQLVEERMMLGYPWRARFDTPPPELESATHPHGEGTDLQEEG